MSFSIFTTSVQSATTSLDAFSKASSGVPANVQSILDLLTRTGNDVELFVANLLQTYINVQKSLSDPKVTGQNRLDLMQSLSTIRQNIHTYGGEAGQRVDFGVLDRYLRDADGHARGNADVHDVAAAAAGEATGRIVGVLDSFRRDLIGQIQAVAPASHAIAGGPTRSTSGTQTTQRGSGTIKTPSDLSTMIARGIFS